MTDFVLAVLHHVLVFGLAGVLAAELVSVRIGLDVAGLRRVGIIDAHYGALAVLIIIVGVLRVIYGVKGPDYYLTNHAFWAKMGAFAVVGLLSIGPTTRIFAWRRRARADPGYLVPAEEVRSARRFLLAEVVVFAFIPIFAAAMARGLG
jgi:putative membrane protein